MTPAVLELLRAPETRGALRLDGSGDGRSIQVRHGIVRVNIDWSRLVHAHRQTEAEPRAWCEEARVGITRVNQQERGYTVVARKR